MGRQLEAFTAQVAELDALGTSTVPLHRAKSDDADPELRGRPANNYDFTIPENAHPHDG